nr:hypothetical protein Itr_chr12CG03490 [Ipomoea trifida]
MSIKVTRIASILPELPLPKTLTNITGKNFCLRMNTGEYDLKGMMMRTVSYRKRQNGALDVEVKTARATTVRESIALFPAGIAGEAARGVRGLGEESENVVGMERVSDLFVQIEAIGMEGEVAGFAGVDW